MRDTSMNENPGSKLPRTSVNCFTFHALHADGAAYLAGRAAALTRESARIAE